MHIIFPKGQTVEGKEEREDEEAPEHRTPYPHAPSPHGLTDTDRAATATAAAQVTKNVQNRPPARVRQESGRTTDDTSATRGREGGSGGWFVQCVALSLSLSLSQGFSDVADVKAGGLLRHHVSVMHEEVIPDIEDAKHFTIGAGRGSQNLHFGRKYFRESFESLK